MEKIISICGLIFVFGFFSKIAFGQISLGGEPYSFNHSVDKSIDIISMQQIDVNSLLSEDQITPKDLPYRFGYGFDVNYNLNNCGNWLKLEDGSRLWRLHIISKGAYSINLIYDKFLLPDSAKFYIYNFDKTMVIGAFTSRNNKLNGKFATGLVKGDEIILEYYEPNNVSKPGEISIARIVHAYKNLFNFDSNLLGKVTTGFGSSGSCNNNVYCSEAEDWENEVHSVGRLIVENGTALCSGSFVNNVKRNYAPYLLTADHCLGGDVNTWIIWFNYESSTCANPSSGPSYQTLSGATLKANNSASDFALVMFDETPPLNYNIYYNGWSNINSASSSSVCIHHPSGDIKKISYDDNAAVSSTWSGTPSNSHWKVIWDDGTTEGGSSGAPLINSDHRVVGQLHGGTASCDNPDSPDYFGKFSMSWNYGSSSSNRLKDWLDPNNTGATVINGMEDGMLSAGELPASATWSGSHSLTGNVSIPSGKNLIISSGTTITFYGFGIILDGGSLTIQSGVTNNFVYVKNGSTLKAIFGSIQSAINYSISGQTIELLGNTTYNENINLTNKSYRTLAGNSSSWSILNGTITLNNADNTTINLLKVKNKVTITNSDNVYINFRSDHPNCYVESINSDVYFYDPYFFQSQVKAFYGHDNGDAEFFKGSFHNKSGQGAYFHYWTYGDFTEPIFCSNAFDIYASGMCYVLVRNYGYFTGATPGSTVSATVSYTDWRTCTTQLAKQGTDSEVFSEGDEIIGIGSSKSDFDNIMADYRQLKSSLNEVQKTGEPFNPLNYSQEFDNLKISYKKVIHQYPESNEAILSLGRIGYLYRTLGDYSGLTTYVNNLLNDKKYQTLFPHILNLEKNSQIKLGKYDEALELSDQFIKQYPTHLLLL